MQIESIILDVDGTLWDSTELVAKSWNRAIRDIGITHIDVTADRLKTLFGRTMKEIADVVLAGVPRKKKHRSWTYAVSTNMKIWKMMSAICCIPM